MLLGSGLLAMHLVMADCPTDKPNDPSCIYMVAMDFYGPQQHARALCDLNVNFLNPQMKQVPRRHIEARCWTPAVLNKQKTVL